MSKKNHKRRPKQFRRRTQPGAPPGVVAVDPAAKPTRIHAICYGPDLFDELTIAEPGELRELVNRYPVTWINVDGLGDGRKIEEIGRIFGLHQLALEDVVNVHQRAKVERYQEHLFIVARMAALKDRFEAEQISFFLGSRFVITFQEEVGDCWDPVRERLRTHSGRLRSFGPDYLTYALIDGTIDSYYPVLDGYEERLDDLDEDITTGSGERAVASLHAIRSDLRQMRRAIGPHRDAISELIRGAGDAFGEETRIHLRDCYDHTIQIIEAVDIYREMCTDLREFQLTKMSARVNDVMKVLTIISTIFIPLTFIVGVYGMNFDAAASPWNMPELKWPYGYPLVWGVMIGMVIGMVLFFRRKGWIGRGARIRF